MKLQEQFFGWTIPLKDLISYSSSSVTANEHFGSVLFCVVLFSVFWMMKQMG